MALSDLYVTGPIGGESGSEYLSPARSAGAPEFRSDGAGPSIGDLFSVGKGAFKAFAPQTYADATSFIPSWSDIGGALGFESGAAAGGAEAAGMGFMDSAAFGGGTIPAAGGVFGGAMAAFGPAALAYAVANLLAAISKPSDGSVSYGSGWGDLDGGFTPNAGRTDGANGLYDMWVGDRDWYSGGDPSSVERMPIDFGSMSRKRLEPYYSLSGVAYSTPDLAVSSGRQVARGMMGLPVTYERLPNVFDPINGQQDLAGYVNAKSMPVYDAPALFPEEWDAKMDQQNRMGGYGEGQTSLDVDLDAWKAGLDPRQREFFDTGLDRNMLYVATGPASPDWGGMATGDELAGISGNFTKPAERDVLSGYQWGAIG